MSYLLLFDHYSKRKRGQNSMIKRSTKPIKRSGRKGNRWAYARKKLKQQSVERNVMFCEFQLPGCWNTVHGYSHPKRRRFTKDEELMEGCVASCNSCHAKVEADKENRVRLHQEAIERREVLRYEAA